MRYRTDEPLFTTLLDDAAAFRPSPGSLYITGTSVEDRSHHLAAWEAACVNVTFARLVTESATTAEFACGETTYVLRLRSASEIVSFLASRLPSAVYLDVTGLPHRVWAPLLRAVRTAVTPSYCVYVEPRDYRKSEAPTEASIYDLSERVEGIAPLPGFVSLAVGDNDSDLFVPLLGFEGARFAFALEAAQPDRLNIYPVIGVPGFRPEYPFDTYFGNRAKLAETRAWQNVRFASANCPFALYHVLVELGQARGTKRLRIATIGTKPHAVGAVLYYLDYPASTEVIYDHPVRKAKRTSGTGRVCLYDLSLLPPVRPDRN